MTHKQQRRHRNYMITRTADLTDINELLLKTLNLITNMPHTKYAIIKHDRDEGSDHYHVALQLQNAMTITALAKAYDVAPNFIERWDGRVNNMWSYMVHATKDAKNAKADYTDYITNDDKFKTNVEDYTDVVARASRATRRATNEQELDITINNILDGTTNKAHLLKPDMRKFYYENYTKIERALKIRTESLRTDPPQNTTLYLYGESGTGKTTKAKEIARRLYPDNWTISSSANDPLQDYLGEKCLILDDFRPQTHDFIDLLALLDPLHRERTHKSRYYNKPIGTEMIILTSIFSLDDIQRFYEQLHPREDMKQLRRRIQQVTMLLSDKDETTMLYDPLLDKYTPTYP